VFFLARPRRGMDDGAALVGFECKGAWARVSKPVNIAFGDTGFKGSFVD
jgi:hypothetical protein